MRPLPWMVAAVLAACGGDGSSTDDSPTPDAPVPPDGPAGCARTPAAADRPRFVVVSHPYDAAGERAGRYEVLALSTDGALTRPGRTFTMGRASFGSIAFTPDGEVGLVALEDGKLGVFRLDPAGMPTVVDDGFAGSFYASDVIVDPRGDRAYVLDGNTRENGGGIYLVTLGCDGTPTDHGKLATAKLPGALVIRGDRALVAAADYEASAAGHDVHALAWSDAPALAAGVDAFGAEDAIVGGAALTADGATFLVGDTSQFSSAPNRVAIVGVTAGGLTARGTVPVEDPQAIAASPFGDVAVVASAFGDALFVLDANGDGGAWRVRGPVAYKDGVRPQLPGDLAMIERGALRGHVFVAENVSLRHLAFRDTGAVDDLGSLALGGGLDNINGAIGVTP